MSEIQDLRLEMDTRFDKVDTEIRGIEEKITKIKVALGQKISWAWYFGSLILIFGVLATILSAMWAEIKGISEKTYTINTNFSSLIGELSGLELIRENKTYENPQ